MTDITQYGNPLLKQFSDRFNLGIVFDSNGVPVNTYDASGNFTGFKTSGGAQKVSYSDFEKFFNDAANNSANTRRLLVDGTISSEVPAVKFFYEGSTNGAYNSVLANSEVERLGIRAVSIDRTALGQLALRSNFKQLVNNRGRYPLNVILSCSIILIFILPPTEEG
jgi:hypothetical protein